MFGFNRIGKSFGDIFDGCSTNGVLLLAEFVSGQVHPLPKCKYISELAKLVHVDLESI
jgi:hypothetical protein